MDRCGKNVELQDAAGPSVQARRAARRRARRDVWAALAARPHQPGHSCKGLAQPVLAAQPVLLSRKERGVL